MKIINLIYGISHQLETIKRLGWKGWEHSVMFSFGQIYGFIASLKESLNDKEELLASFSDGEAFGKQSLEGRLKITIGSDQGIYSEEKE